MTPRTLLAALPCPHTPSPCPHSVTGGWSGGAPTPAAPTRSSKVNQGGSRPVGLWELLGDRCPRATCPCPPPPPCPLSAGCCPPTRSPSPPPAPFISCFPIHSLFSSSPMSHTSPESFAGCRLLLSIIFFPLLLTALSFFTRGGRDSGVHFFPAPPPPATSQLLPHRETLKSNK